MPRARNVPGPHDTRWISPATLCGERPRGWDSRKGTLLDFRNQITESTTTVRIASKQIARTVPAKRRIGCCEPLRDPFLYGTDVVAHAHDERSMGHGGIVAASQELVLRQYRRVVIAGRRGQQRDQPFVQFVGAWYAVPNKPETRPGRAATLQRSGFSAVLGSGAILGEVLVHDSEALVYRVEAKHVQDSRSDILGC